MKPLHFLFSFLVIGLLASCTDNDEPLDDGGSGSLTVLTLSSDANSTDIPVGRTVNFTATGNDDADYTDQISLVVNESTVDGSSYTFEEEGDFNVKAVFDDLTSNTLTFNVTQDMILRVDRASLLKEQVATFTLFDVITQTDATAEGTFYVNGSAIEGNTFNTATTGSYEVYAEYQDESGETQATDTKTVKVVAPTQRALIEDYTGTWCGYCPRLQSVISDLEEMTENAVVITLHASSSDTDPDPYEYEKITQLVDAYNEYNEFPTGRINRIIHWNDNDPTTPLDYMGGESPIGIAATTEVNGTQLNVDVRVASTEGLTNRKIVVAALEDKLYHDQKNYLNTDPDSEWYGAGNPIPDYENNDVMRHAMTNVFGDDITETGALEDFTKSYSMDLSDYCEDPANAEVVVFVLDNDGLVKQAKKIGLNESVEFE